MNIKDRKLRSHETVEYLRRKISSHAEINSRRKTLAYEAGSPTEYSFHCCIFNWNSQSERWALTLVNRRMEKRYSDLTTYMLLSPSDGASVARREPASQRPVNNSRNQPAQRQRYARHTTTNRKLRQSAGRRQRLARMLLLVADDIF